MPEYVIIPVRLEVSNQPVLFYYHSMSYEVKWMVYGYRQGICDGMGYIVQSNYQVIQSYNIVSHQAFVCMSNIAS